MVSGAITDNAPPSKEVASRIRELNEIFDGQAIFKMVGLEQFFEIVRSQCTDIPVYSGDWTDWWADGIGSTPAEVKLYKDAARKYNICKKLDPKEELGSKYFTEKAADELMLYAEHTWGYSSSVFRAVGKSCQCTGTEKISLCGECPYTYFEKFGYDSCA